MGSLLWCKSSLTRSLGNVSPESYVLKTRHCPEKSIFQILTLPSSPELAIIVPVTFQETLQICGLPSIVKELTLHSIGSLEFLGNFILQMNSFCDSQAHAIK